MFRSDAMVCILRFFQTTDPGAFQAVLLLHLAGFTSTSSGDLALPSSATMGPLRQVLKYLGDAHRP